MTTDEIIKIARDHADDVSLVGGRVFASAGFAAADGGEPHDAAWDAYVNLQDALGPHGLRLVEFGSDNDTVWGCVEEIPAGES